MNLNQIIDEDEDGIEDESFIKKKNKKNNNNLFNGQRNDDDDNVLSKTQYIPNKFQKYDSNEEKDIPLNGSNNDLKMSNIICPSNKEYCSNHKSEPVEYYCLNCNTKHCSKCLLIMSKESKIHKDHNIIEIEKIKKYNINEIYEDINSLSDITKELSQYKINTEIEEKIIEKKDEFYAKMIDEFKQLISSKHTNRTTKLCLEKQQIQTQLNHIDGVKDNHKEALINFITRDDELGLEDYHKKIKDFKYTDKYIHNGIYNIFINPSLKFVETEFYAVEIREYEENIGEIIGELDIDNKELNKKIQLRFNQEAIDEILINLQISLDDLNEDQISYSCHLILKNRNCITSANLNERMVHNGILILGKTIIKNSLKNIVEDHKCNVKLILAEMRM